MLVDDYLKGKRVIIVGPAPTLIGKKKGKIIDGYDVIVRFNNSLPIPEELKEDYGSRTDILSINRFFAIRNKKKISSLIEKYNLKIILSKKKLICDNLFLMKIGVAGFKFPNIGIITISNLLKYDIKSLDITGISFYCSSEKNYIKEYQITKLAKSHDNSILYKNWVLDKKKEDSRLTLWEDVEKFLK